MARLYADENFPQPVVEALRRLGHEVQTSHDAGNSGRAVPDEAVLQFAQSHNLAVLTLNRKHFIRLHQTHPEHPGIIVCTFDSDFAGQATRIHAAIQAQEQLTGHLIRVNRPAPG